MVNQYPSVRLVFDRKHLASPSRKGVIEIEISFQRKRKWISSGVFIDKQNWNPVNRITGIPESLDLNLKIENKERIILNYIRMLQIKSEEFTWEGLSACLYTETLEESFIKFIEERIGKRNDIKESTKRNHRKLLTALKEFKSIEFFSDLSSRKIEAFDEWLRGRKTYKQTTIASYHKFLKVYVNDAIRKGLIQKNPYIGLKIDRGKSGLRKYLTMQEVLRIENAEIPAASLIKIRDLFIFQCYTGIAYADLCNFDFSKVMQRDGKWLIHDTRRKSGEDYYLVLLSKPMEILKKYGFKLPSITNQQYNMRLKLVAFYAGIKKPLTTHMARHTYASMCLNAGVKIEVLAQMLGHTDIKTTQIYAKMFNTTVEKAFEQLEENLMRQAAEDK